MRGNNRSSSSVWLLGLIVFLSFCVISMFGYSVFKENQKKKQLEKEIDILKNQAMQIERENMALEERIAYLGSRDYQEVQAKDKLNLQKPEENVVIIAQSPVRKESVTDLENKTPEIHSKDQPNFIKWWNYFFGKK